MKLKKLLCVLAFSSTIALAACGTNNAGTTTIPTTGGNTPTDSTGTEALKLEKIQIKAKDSLTKLVEGETLSLMIEATPVSMKPEVAWSSSDTTIASISEDGTVTALKEGKVIITAVAKENDKIKDTYKLTIEKAPEIMPESITLTTPDSLTSVDVGKSLTITAAVLPEGANQGVKFASSDDTIATVSPAGVVTALKEGKVTITCTSKRDTSITKTIEITVAQGEFIPDAKWEGMAFSNHEAYMNAQKDTDIKVKGVCTFKFYNAEKTSVSYFLQDGNDGFYIYGQEIAKGDVKVGSAYAVGGVKAWKNGCNSIGKIGYAMELAEKISANTIDLTQAPDLRYDAQKANMGSLCELNDAIITELPSDVASSKGYNIGLKTAASNITLRVSPGELGMEGYTAAGEIVKSLSVTQKISVKGIMNSFGYGKPASQILLTSAENIVASPLTDEDKVNIVLANTSLPATIARDATTIDLPKADSKFSDVMLEWSSNSAIIDATTGTVSHPDRDESVTITLKASLAGITKTKEFKLNVISKDDAYLEEVARLDFEDAEPGNKYGCSATKSGYKNGNVTLGGNEWALNNALIGGADDDRRNGTFSARMQTSGDDNSITLVNGLAFDTLQFVVADYGTNRLGAVVQISYAVGDSTEFTTLDTEVVVSAYDKQMVRVKLPVEKGALVRVRISVVKGTGQRINIDDICLLAEK